VNSDLYDYAVRLLGRRAHSRHELRRKLARRAAPSEVARVIRRLERQGYLDDRQFAALRASSLRRRRHWGDRRIAFDLRRLGVDARIIRFTLRRLAEELPEEDALQQVVENRLAGGPPSTAQELKSLYDHCIRLGFRPETVRSRLSGLFREICWE
jgi:regulatory protein